MDVYLPVAHIDRCSRNRSQLGECERGTAAQCATLIVPDSEPHGISSNDTIHHLCNINTK